jgi:hypothetical protein
VGLTGTVLRGQGYTLDLASPLFEAYYQRQAIVPEEQWPTLLATLRQVLPVTLRVNGLDPMAPRYVLELRQARDGDGVGLRGEEGGGGGPGWTLMSPSLDG